MRMFSPLSHYLLIIALFSIDNAFRNFHVIFFPLVSLLTCTAMGEDLGINPRKSRIMNLVDSWRLRRFVSSEEIQSDSQEF